MAKLDEEIAHNGEFKRQLDETSELCRHIEVYFPIPPLTLTMWFHCRLHHVFTCMFLEV